MQDGRGYPAKKESFGVCVCIKCVHNVVCAVQCSGGRFFSLLRFLSPVGIAGFAFVCRLWPDCTTSLLWYKLENRLSLGGAPHRVGLAWCDE